jgi:hypothetical protein
MEHDIHAFEFPLNKNYSKFLFYSSFMIGISSCLAYYMQDTILTIFLFLLFLTSINYWRKPELGLRRQIDMFLCGFCTIYFIVVSFLFLPEFNRIMYINTAICVGIFYICEYVLCFFKSVKWIIFHMAMHIYTAFFPVIVFSVFLEEHWKDRGFQFFTQHRMMDMVEYIDTIIELIKKLHEKFFLIYFDF